MTTTEIVATVISALSMLITAILAWISIYRVNRVNVSFTGTPLDKVEFDRVQAEHKAIHDQLFAKIGGAERGIESRITARFDKFEMQSTESRRIMHQDITSIGNDVAALKKVTELANQRAFQMDEKIDRLIERQSS